MTSDILQIVSERIATYAKDHPRTHVSRHGGIRVCAEFERIDALPRRQWSAEESSLLVSAMTSLLMQPGGQQTLKAIQALALYEIAAYGGLLGPIGVGQGKTLVSLLAPVVLNAARPLLILPAKLIDKTRREIVILASHWRIAANIDIISYEWLGRTYPQKNDPATYLVRTRPDMIILDEAHKVRNKHAAVTRRVIRYAEKHSPRVIPLSGTLIRKRLNDWAHLGKAALGDRSPAPHRWNTIEHWGNALDMGGTMNPGCLSMWQAQEETVREGYRRRVVDTPGIIATTDSSLEITLNGEAWHCDLPSGLTEALDQLKESWILPDGFIVTDPLHYYRAARQLALGCFYRWKYQPPDAWREARRLWSSFVRHACRYLKDNGTPFDSEKQVANACAGERIKDEGVYAAWRAIRDTFIPEIEHVWVSDSIVKALIAAANDEHDPGIVWIESIAVGHMMHAQGLPYYGKKGMTPEGRNILDAKGPIAASINSISEGHNLQDRWSRNIVSAPLQCALRWEQMLGRTVRIGQQADEVTVQVAMLGQIHRDSWLKAREHARFLEQITGQEQKLLEMTLVDLPDTGEYEY